MGLAERLILALTNRGGLVFDPYLGAGTTAATAVMCERRAAGSDIAAEYLHIALERVQQAAQGTLPYRQMNKPVYKPDPSSTLASPPPEWQKKR